MIRTGHKGELEATCNECGAEEYGGNMDFREFVEDLKEQGWKVYRDEEEDTWQHLCPDCR